MQGARSRPKPRATIIRESRRGLEGLRAPRKIDPETKNLINFQWRLGLGKPRARMSHGVSHCWLKSIKLGRMRGLSIWPTHSHKFSREKELHAIKLDSNQMNA